MHGTVADLQQLVHAVAGRSSDVEAAIGDAAESLRHAAEASARLPGLVARIGRGAEAVERVADEASATAKDASRAVQQLDGESLVELQRLLAEMTEAAAALGRLSRELERNRGALLGAQQPRPGPGE